MNELEKLLEHHHISQEELNLVLKGAKQRKPSSLRQTAIPHKSQMVRYGLISDTHMGHKCFRPDILQAAVYEFQRKSVEFILLPGDILEGMSGRDGHILELSHIGATNQLNYAHQQLAQFKQKIYAITAEQSHDGWFSSKGNAGLEVGPELQRRLGKDKFEFMGTDEQDLVLGNGLRIRMIHPGEGTAYAISYMGQKYLNSLSGGQKPNIVHSGHHHKWLYMFYRNVHFTESGTLEEQTIFMRKKKTPAHLGFAVVDVAVGKQGGVNMFCPQFFPFYE